MKKEPIKNQYEANSVFSHLVDQTVEVIGCSKDQAIKRINALMKSKECNGLQPDNILFKMIVDKYMNTPI